MLPPLKGKADFNDQHGTPPVSMRRTGDWHGMEMDAPDKLPLGGAQYGLFYFGKITEPVAYVRFYFSREEEVFV